MFYLWRASLVGSIFSPYAILFGEEMLRRADREFIRHVHQERNHQGLQNRLSEAAKEVRQCSGDIPCRELWGGLLRDYSDKLHSRYERDRALFEGALRAEDARDQIALSPALSPAFNATNPTAGRPSAHAV